MRTARSIRNVFLVSIMLAAVFQGNIKAGPKTILVEEEMVQPGKSLKSTPLLFSTRNIRFNRGTLVKDGSSVLIVRGEFLSKHRYPDIVVEMEITVSVIDVRYYDKSWTRTIPVRIVRPVPGKVVQFIGVGKLGNDNIEGNGIETPVTVEAYHISSCTYKHFKQEIDRVK